MKQPILAIMPSFTASFFHSEKPVNMLRDHYHDMYELYFITEGERNIYFNGICYKFKRGDFIIIQPFTSHRTESEEATFFGRYVINFKKEDLESMFSASDLLRIKELLQSSAVHLNEKTTALVEKLLDMIRKYNNDNNATSDKLKISTLILVLDIVCKYYEESGFAAPGSSATAAIHPSVQKCIRYVSAHYAEDITLDFIANYCHISKSRFCSIFKETTGTTFLNYLNNMRISQAQNLLVTTDKPLHEIAALSGFSSTSHMTRIFHTVHTSSPTKWRNMLREKI